MPPANSPDGPSDSPLPPLAYLESPVADLASTLHTRAAEEAQEGGTAASRPEFIEGELRRMHEEWATNASTNPGQNNAQHTTGAIRDPSNSMDASDEPSTAATSPPPRARETLEDLTRRERLQRVLARLNRLHEPANSGGAPSTQPTPAAYGEQPPSLGRQSLYDWAPAFAEAAQDEAELESILSEMRQHPNVAADPAVLRVMARAEMIRQRGETRQHQNQTDNVAARATGESAAEARRRRERERFNLRRGAVLQRARQEGSPSATDRMLRYVVERERSGMSEEEERALRQGWIGGPSERNSVANRENERRDRVRQERDRHERVAAFRRGYLAEGGYPRLPRIASPTALSEDGASAQTPTTTLAPSRLLENTLKYLSDLRDASSFDDSVSLAVANSLATGKHFVDQHEGFVMNLERVRPLAASSWMRPGAVFEGHQHATNYIAGDLTHRREGNAPHNRERIVQQLVTPGPATGTPRPQENVNRNVEQINPNFVQHGSHRPILGANRPWASHEPKSSSHFDQWPVRFTLHAVDHEAMTLQGTMEAYDVPQHTGPITDGSEIPPRAGKKAAPITTYVEGQIIDVRTHSFLTPSSRSASISPLDRYEEAIRGERRTTSTGPYETAPHNATPYTTHATSIPFPAATAATDASNWAHLPPFSTMNSECDPPELPQGTGWHPPSSKPPVPNTIAHKLLSTSSLNDLMDQYIFMRWKERCFIHSKDEKCEFQTSRGAAGAARSGALEEGDQDRGHGLTISGFYYVSLRRSDGKVEGLYFDPASTPHQVLRLEGGRTGVDGGVVVGGGGGGAWGFV